MLQKKLGIEARSVVMIAEIIEHDSHCHVESLVFHFLLLNNNSKGKSTHTHNINRRSHLGMRQNSGFQNCWDAWMISYSAIHSHQTFGWCVATPPKTLRFYPFEVFLKVSAPDFPNPICLKLWLKSHGLSSCSIMVFKTYYFDKF